ncbi:MAG: hypothetical protein IMX00_01175 [Limnochordales bacterium]|nr:hypothetical protein [Limnochordales bacterium]
MAVSSEEKSQVRILFTPEEGWRGEIYLRPEVTVGAFAPEGVAPQLLLRLGAGGQTADFQEETWVWSLSPEEITLFASGPLWEGGPPAIGVLGEFRLPLPGYLGGDSRRNGVRGVALTEIGILPSVDADLFYGWTSQSVPPLLRSEESPGSDYLTGGGRAQWRPAPDLGVELAAAWREGSLPADYFATNDMSQPGGSCFYREDVGAVALSRPWRGLQLSAWAGWQARRVELYHPDGQVQQRTGFAALELVGEKRDKQRRRHSQTLRIYAVPAEFFPWAARRSTAANNFYRWRGEAGVEWEGATWLGAEPSRHKMTWRLGLGQRVQELPDHDELIADLVASGTVAVSPSSPVSAPSLPLEAVFGRGRVELAGKVPPLWAEFVHWWEHCQYRWRGEVESGRGGWTDLRIWRTGRAAAGPVREWTPAYTVRWEAPGWGTAPSEEDAEVLDKEESAADASPSALGGGLTHTLSLTLKLSLGGLQGVKAGWSRSVNGHGAITDTWSIAYDSPNGWEWRCRWTAPDDPEKATDSYFELRQRFKF